MTSTIRIVITQTCSAAKQAATRAVRFTETATASVGTVNSNLNLLARTPPPAHAQEESMRRGGEEARRRNQPTDGPKK